MAPAFGQWGDMVLGQSLGLCATIHAVISIGGFDFLPLAYGAVIDRGIEFASPASAAKFRTFLRMIYEIAAIICSYHV